MRNILIAIAILALLPAVHAGETHLDFAVPDLLDTDLSGSVKIVDTKVSFNVSGKFERERQEYDRTGNLLNETKWDSEGQCLSTTTNYYSDTGNFERQLYIDYEDGYTNNWEVILSPETRQIALKKKDGSAVIYTYSPAGYVINYRYVDGDKNLKSASCTKRDERNRRMEYTRMDGNKRPLYTYWFKWKDGGFINRERQRYRKEKGERLHTYDYLKHDEHGNWTQRLMVRYDIGDSNKDKIYERLVVRRIDYYEEEEEEPNDTEVAEGATNTTDVTSSNAPPKIVTGKDPTESNSTNTMANAIPEENPRIPEEISNPGDPSATEQHVDSPSIAMAKMSQEELKSKFTYTFDDISDKVVIITSKNREGKRYAGSGFIAKMDGRTYLFTNQHIVMGMESFRFNTAYGETLSPRRIELSETRDIARILVDDRDALKISENFALNNPLGVFGNSEGAGVATELFGKITGLGKDLVEVNADFVSGNSGSPVLDTKQEVIGIASYVRVIWSPPEEKDNEAQKSVKRENKDEENEKELTSKTRRFCYRLDNLKWKSVNWEDYNEKYGRHFHSSEAIAENVFNIMSIWAESPVEFIPGEDNMETDIAKWVKKHNDIVARCKRRQFNRNSFFNAYSNSLEVLGKVCHDRARRLRLIASQRELTGYLRDKISQNASSLEYAEQYIQGLADSIRELD